jgi:hypothetical protein
VTKEKEIVKKVEILNSGTLKLPKWDDKKGNSCLVWKIKFDADMMDTGLEEASKPVLLRMERMGKSQTEDTLWCLWDAALIMRKVSLG